MAIAAAPTVKLVEPELLAGDLIQCGHSLFGIIWINGERMSGAACFYGTRVPIQNLFDYLEGRNRSMNFLMVFPA